MKKLASILLAAALLCGLAACGGAGSAGSSEPAAESGAPASAAGSEAASDAASAPPAVSLAGVTVTPPEGFAPVEDARYAAYDQVYAAEDGSHILVYTLEGAAGFAAIDRQRMEEEVAAQYTRFEAVETTGYSEAEILGCPARRLDLSATYLGEPVTQTLILIQGDGVTVNLALTDLSGDGSHAEALRACIESIQAK